MAIEKRLEFEIEHKFDAKNSRHFLNGFCTVLHCHHFATLYTQLADDAKDFHGERLLKEASEDTFFHVLSEYFCANNITAVDDIVSISEQYWKAVGMGLIRFTAVGPFAAAAEMEYSHVDEGWLKKWGSREEPVNFITSGFVAAVASLCNGKPPRAYQVREIQSLVRGDAVSAFKAVLR